MAVARANEIFASSPARFEDAIQKGIDRANQILRKVRGAWIQDQKIDVVNGRLSEYGVSMKVTFIVND